MRRTHGHSALAGPSIGLGVGPELQRRSAAGGPDTPATTPAVELTTEANVPLTTEADVYLTTETT